MRLVITGASGNLGTRLVEVALRAGHQVHAWTSPRLPVISPAFDQIAYTPVELTDPESVAHAFWQARPMAVIHAAALSSLAECYRDPVRAFRINAEATRQLVGLCVAGVSRLVYVSTDLVFSGREGHYHESSPTQPLSQYGKSKLDGERAVLDHPGHLVVRLSWLAGKGPACRPNFLDQLIQRLQENMPIELFEDEWRTPLGTCTAAEVLLLLAQHDIAGILHLGGAEKFSRYQMGLILARLLGKPESLVRATQQNNQATPELRPRDVSLDSSLFQSKFPGCFIPTYEAVLRLELGLGDLVGGTSHQSPATTSPMAT